METESSARSRLPTLARRLGWFIGLILSAGLPSCAVAPKPVSYEGRMISKVIIRHNFPENATRENDERLGIYMRIREGKRYSNELAEDTIRSLWESGHIDNARLLVEEDGQSIRVFVEVEERQRCGPRPSIVGNTVFSDQKLFRSIQPSLEFPITETHAEAAREKLEKFYRQHGYKQVCITINYVRWDKRSVQDFVMVIEEGPRTPPWYERLFQPPGKATAP